MSMRIGEVKSWHVGKGTGQIVSEDETFQVKACDVEPDELGQILLNRGDKVEFRWDKGNARNVRVFREPAPTETQKLPELETLPEVEMPAKIETPSTNRERYRVLNSHWMVRLTDNDAVRSIPRFERDRLKPGMIVECGARKAKPCKFRMYKQGTDIKIVSESPEVA